jgi:hypothetical protein
LERLRLDPLTAPPARPARPVPVRTPGAGGLTAA